MDPLSVVGLVSGIITFIDFSWKLVNGANDIYESASGATKENVHISTVIEDLDNLTRDLDVGVRDLGDTGRDHALRKLTAGCQELSDELLTILSKLRVTENNSSWRALKVKWDSMRKRREIMSIRDRLRDYQSEITLQLNSLLVGQQASMNSQLRRIEHATERFSTARAQEFDKLREELALVTERLTHAGPPEAGQSKFLMDQAKSLHQIRDALVDLRNLSHRVPLENRILEHIWFEGMDAREEAIRDAEEGTFEWLLQGKDGPKATGWSSDGDEVQLEQLLARPLVSEKFLKWLDSEGGVFHLSGKPGSGKSTAMKLIHGHETTKARLTKWASGKILVFAHFYFWNSGSSIQMSLEGLYRSILFEVLRACPELIPELFPEQWAQMKAEGKHGFDNDRELGTAFGSTLFRPSKITQAFHTLVNNKRLDKYRFCFFIDGLDEFQGDSVDHWELAESVFNWSSRDNVKCCVSSRPYTEFLATFKEERRFYLHNLNKLDIYTFSRHMFENDRNFKRIAHSYDRLVLRIVEMSDGVFLWARLVVRVLITSIGRYDSEATLYKKLEILPTDLETLYDRLLEGLDPLDRDLSDLMLLITLHNSKLREDEFPLSVLAMSYLNDLEDKSFPSVSRPEVCTEDELAERFEQVKRQVSSLTKGLLEVGPVLPTDSHHVRDSEGAWSWIFYQRVRFFHRTVPDYLQSSDKLRHDKFDWEMTFARLRLAELASLNKSIVKTYPMNQIRLHQQCEHLLQYLSIEDPGPRTFQSLDLIETQKHALGQFSPPISWYWVFDHRMPGYSPWFHDEPSFNHFITYHGYDAYILSEIKKGKKLGDRDDLNTLLSAACGIRPQVRFVSELLNAGYSPKTKVAVYSGLPDSEFHVITDASVWMLFVGQFVDYVVKSISKGALDTSIAERAQLLERVRILVELLAEGGADANLEIKADSSHGSPSYVATLGYFLLVTLSFLWDGESATRSLGGQTRDWPGFCQSYLRGMFPSNVSASSTQTTKGRENIKALEKASQITVQSKDERVIIRSGKPKAYPKLSLTSFRLY